jgi:hypothetical protein
MPYFSFIAVAIVWIGWYSSRGSIFFTAGFFLLALAFSLSSLPFFDSSEHLAIVLEGDPSAHVRLINRAVYGGILPGAAGIALCAVDLTMRRKALTESFRALPLLLVGATLTYFNASILKWTVTECLRETRSATANQLPRIIPDIEAVYTAYWWISLTWLSVGVLFIILSIFPFYRMIRHRRTDSTVQTKPEP